MTESLPAGAAGGPPGPHDTDTDDPLGTADSTDAVDVWTLWIPDHAAAAAARSGILDPEEAKRAAGFQDPAARRRFVTSHVGLRVLLGVRLGTAPQDVTLVRERCGMPGCEKPHGRPAAAGHPGVHFSLSHAGDIALYALAASPVGADIESLDLVGGGLERMARRLHPDERRALDTLHPTVRQEALLGCWVRKEAFLKGMGTGLPGGVGAHHVGLAAALAPAWAPPGPDGWALLDVPAPDGCHAAVALRLQGPAGRGRIPTIRTSRLLME
ncbi:MULTISPECIES: 4'-phosphopantetheinyl transferase family protein [Streptomyces]|uniref:4'-phosphopantetheinyl transferase family protein n=1 Tax=Streptomyces TaxID=1883 RepID=UPI000B9DE4C4|nr:MULTISPECIES: 4'-phosphopantetheinyl transferase superfamily protein [Streptomyces]MYU52884.1 4'-phosphopantetheinyl transferase superfamily protein [Streptomyces sp. SID7805]